MRENAFKAYPPFAVTVCVLAYAASGRSDSISRPRHDLVRIGTPKGYQLLREWHRLLWPNVWLFSPANRVS